MPKIKTHKGLSKRIKISARGRVKHKRAFKGHLMSSKSAKRRRHLKTRGLITGVQARKIKRLLGR